MDTPEEDLAARGRTIFDQLRADNAHGPARASGAALEDPTGLTVAGVAVSEADEQPDLPPNGAGSAQTTAPAAGDPGSRRDPTEIPEAAMRESDPGVPDDPAVGDTSARPDPAASGLGARQHDQPESDSTRGVSGSDTTAPDDRPSVAPVAPEPATQPPEQPSSPGAAAVPLEGERRNSEAGQPAGSQPVVPSAGPEQQQAAADEGSGAAAAAPVGIGSDASAEQPNDQLPPATAPPRGDDAAHQAPAGEASSVDAASAPGGSPIPAAFHVEQDAVAAPASAAPASEAAAIPGTTFHVEPATASRQDPAPAADTAPDPAPPRPARALPRIMAVANQKGGVGKTTTAVNLGAALAELGYRTLVVDLDPQGNATTGLGINARTLEVSAYDVLMRELPVEDAVEPTSVRNLFVVPATIDLAGAEIELVPAFSRELRLKRALEGVADDFDFTLIDCPPSLGLLTVNALAAATEVVVPVQCEYYALEGLSALLRNVQLVQTNLNRALEVSTIVLTMYDARTKLAEQVADEVRAHFGNVVCRQMVPRTVRLSEAPSFGQPIIVFDPNSRGAIAYRELAKEVAGGTPQRVG